MFTFILFNKASDGMEVYNRLLEEGFSITIAPSPREASSCCGISVLLKNPDEVEDAKNLLTEEGFKVMGWYKRDKPYNTSRDKYL